MAIIELGGAGGWNISGGRATGGSAAVELTPIEKWLEIEIGTTLLFARHSAEWSADALFKKPWTLSRKTEIMVGIGPELVHTREFGTTRNSLAGEIALDFMYWPGARHRLGWFIEPAFEYTFGHIHERSIGITSGLIIAIP